jgi:hypothetical protein
MGEVCAVVDMAADGTMQGMCVDGTNGTALEGEPCLQDDDTYWGSCSADHHCLEVPAGNPVCVPLCDAAVPCMGEDFCTRGVFGGTFADLGLCMDYCTVMGGDSGCPVPSDTCAFTGLFGESSFAGIVPVGLCLPGNGLAAGEPCTPYEDSDVWDCANGLVCASPGGLSPTCVPLCYAHPDDPTACPPGTECHTHLFSDVYPLYGLCL